jgi:hypothetical protein
MGSTISPVHSKLEEEEARRFTIKKEQVKNKEEKLLA